MGGARRKVGAARARAGVGYLRCSTDKQPLSLDDQRKAITKWAQDHAIPILRWYIDDAISGASASDRADFQKMMRDVEERRDVTHVLCYDVSRFGRTDSDEAGFYRFRLREAGAEVVYVAETAVNGSDTDDLLLPVLQFQKREYLRSLSRDTLRGLIGLAKKGAWCGGPAPFGYARQLRDPSGTPIRLIADGERAPTESGATVFLVPGDPREVEAVALAWEMYHVQRSGLDSIRNRFIELGLTPPRAKFWRTSSVRVIVLNPVYTGRVTYGLRTNAKFYRATSEGAKPRSKMDLGMYEMDPNGDPVVVENAHTALVSEIAVKHFGAWEQKTRERRRGADVSEGKQREYRKLSVYSLTGFLRCTRCGFRFIGTTRRRKGHAYEDYICSGYNGSGKGLCERYAVPREKFEVNVKSVILGQWLSEADPDRARKHVEADLEQLYGSREDNGKRADEVRAALAKLDAKMIAIVQAIDPEYAEATNAALSKLRAQRDQLKVELAGFGQSKTPPDETRSYLQVVERLIRSFEPAWAIGKKEDRKQLLACFMKEVIINPELGTADVVLWRFPKTPLAPTNLLGSSEPVVGKYGSGGGI